MTPGTTTCPVCGAAMPGHWQEYPEYPFCTQRCRTIDLGRWLGEEYKVAGHGDDRSTPGEFSGGSQNPR